MPLHTDSLLVLGFALLSAGLLSLGCSDDTAAPPNNGVVTDMGNPSDAPEDANDRDIADSPRDAEADIVVQDDAGVLDSGADLVADLVADQGPFCGDNTCQTTESCTTCPEDCVCAPTSPIYFDAPMPTATQTNLSCDVPGIQAIQPSVETLLRGSDVSSVIGLDTQFAGIGAKLELRNNQFPMNGVNVLEPRSGAGAGWQTSFLVEDAGGVGIIVFNQAAGNAVGYQWGYGTSLTKDGASIYATTLNPLDSDHVHEVAGGHSPCEPSGYVFDDGAIDFSGSLVRTNSGDAMAWRNRYRVKSRVSQAWSSWSAEQAFYLSRPVARAHNLRVYLKRGATEHGPIALYDPFSIPGESCANSFCNTGAYDYAVLVWTISGIDIGVAIPDLSLGTSINLEQTTYCLDASDDACGNINFHSWLLRGGGAVSYTPGQVRSLSKEYYVGTLAQLADLGFGIW